MSIVLQNVSKTYKSSLAVNNISFTLNKGEIVGFIGPNGAGKSTTMKIINGYIPQTIGIVTVNGIDVLENPVEVRKNIGYLPENNPLYLNMYVREYLLFIAGLYNMGQNKRDRVEEMIQTTGLSIEANKKIGALSKGYRQRVGLAQALVHDPAILILDEPTTGLDPNQIIEIRNLISELGKSKTVLMSTHIMQEVEAICDRIIVINKGEIVANDTPQTIMNNANKQQTIVVEFDKDIDAEKLRSIVEISNLKKHENLWLIETTGDTDIRPIIFRFAVDNGLTILSQQRKEKKLEEVFGELTR